MRTRVEQALGIDQPTPGRVDYDPRVDNVADANMRARRIPPQKGTLAATQLDEVGI